MTLFFFFFFSTWYCSRPSSEPISAPVFLVFQFLNALWSSRTEWKRKRQRKGKHWAAVTDSLFIYSLFCVVVLSFSLCVYYVNTFSSSLLAQSNCLVAVVRYRKRMLLISSFCYYFFFCLCRGKWGKSLRRRTNLRWPHGHQYVQGHQQSYITALRSTWSLLLLLLSLPLSAETSFHV